MLLEYYQEGPLEAIAQKLYFYLEEMARTLLNDTNLPKYFQDEAINTA